MGRKQKRLSEEALILAYRIREARLKKYKTVKEAAELFPVEKGVVVPARQAYSHSASVGRR